MNFSTEYPLWMILFCLIAGCGYSAIMYYKNKRNEFSPLLTKVMAFLRFTLIFVISFLLLSPLLKTTNYINEKPIIIFAQDNSQSITINKDSVFYKNEYKKNVEEFLAELSKKYEIKTLAFDDKVIEKIPYNYNGKQTDISNLTDEIITRFTNRNIGAVILASDGVYNKGKNPLYSAEKIKAPFYTIALGDTNIRKDLFIQKVNYNRMTYLGNTFPIEIIVNATKATGNTAKLRVSNGQKEIFNKIINISGNQFIETVNVVTEAKVSGLQKYTISLSPLDNEITLSNNTKDIYIEVLDSRQKILILANAPHPDISAIKQTLENNRNYEVQNFMADNFTKSVTDYNLIILHQLPSLNNVMGKVFAEIQKNNIPVLYILGTQTNYNQFNAINTGLSITVKNQNLNEVLPSISLDFPYFNVSEETKKMMVNFPPLISVYGSFKMSPSCEPLIFQKIGNVTTQQPLVLFNQNLGNKCGIVTGEGLWRWKLANYAQKSNTDAFDEIITKAVQYLSVRVEKDYFKVSNLTVYEENQDVEFDAELYNDSYELINEADVNMTITNSSGSKFNYQFSKTSNAYHLNAGILPQGEYKYQAIVKQKNKTLTQNALFTVSKIDAEFINPVANHQLLYNLAKSKGGEMLFPTELEKLTKLLTSRDDIKTVKYTQKKYNDFVGLLWLLIMILSLLTAEWFLRKRNGGY